MDYAKRIKEIDAEIAQLKAVISKREVERNALATLDAMQADEFDIVISPKVKHSDTSVLDKNTQTDVEFKSSNKLETAPHQPIKMPRKSDYKNFLTELLCFIGEVGKNLKDVAPFYIQKNKGTGNPKDPYGRIRAELWKIKNEHSYIENPTPGFYKVSTEGLRFIESQKGESQNRISVLAFFDNKSPTTDH